MAPIITVAVSGIPCISSNHRSKPASECLQLPLPENVQVEPGRMTVMDERWNAMTPKETFFAQSLCISQLIFYGKTKVFAAHMAVVIYPTFIVPPTTF